MKFDTEHSFISRTLDQFCLDRGFILTPDEYGNWLPNIKIIAGGAKGVDTSAIEYAMVNWCNFKEYKADWKKHGKAAGPIRNQQMLDEGKPDVVIAFPGGRGTADMIRRAKAAGIEVIEVSFS